MSLTYHALEEGLALPSDPAATHLLILGNKADIVAKAGNAASLVSRLLGLPSASHPPLSGHINGLVTALADKLSPAYDSGSSLDTFLDVGGGVLVRLTLASLPSGTPSRHNAPAKPHAAADLLRPHTSGDSPLRVLLLLPSPDQALALGAAVARPFSLYSRKSAAKPPRKVDVVLGLSSQQLAPGTLAKVSAVCEGIQLTARLTDTPTNELHTDKFVEEVQSRLSGRAGVGIEVIRGEELRDRGFGGIYGVGKASDHPPALVILSLHKDRIKDKQSVVWVGKGIVYDTGGLSIKTKTGMPGMKRDMAGAAAVFSAFCAAVDLGYDQGPLFALLCLAENSVDSRSARPDDVHVMYSGKTVEINNTDAEGRLVLGDGVAYAAKHLNPHTVIDMATLTGAQGIATGKRHAAIYCNHEGLESVAVEAGKSSGDLVFPVPYVPEFFQPEFRSAIADMKNSVANRDNAQPSCAGQFIGSHLGEWVHGSGKWLHIDMAGPAHIGERATGYGVALLVSMLDQL